MGGYIESPVGVGPAPYSAGPYGSSQDWRNMQQGQRKNTRALQVGSLDLLVVEMLTILKRRVIRVAHGRPNVTRGNPSVGTVETITSIVVTRK
jgi:hypothetical protein